MNNIITKFDEFILEKNMNSFLDENDDNLDEDILDTDDLELDESDETLDEKEVPHGAKTTDKNLQKIKKWIEEYTAKKTKLEDALESMGKVSIKKDEDGQLEKPAVKYVKTKWAIFDIKVNLLRLKAEEMMYKATLRDKVKKGSNAVATVKKSPSYLKLKENEKNLQYAVSKFIAKFKNNVDMKDIVFPNLK